MKTVAGLVSKSSVALGIAVNGVEMARQWKEAGARYLATTIEGVVGPAMRHLLQQMRQ
jgi:hypothetical protein